MKNWVFDFDGTLVDSEGYFSQTFNYALEPFNIQVEASFMEKIRHKHPHRIFEDLLGPEEQKTALERVHEASRGRMQNIHFFPQMLEAIESLQQKGCGVSIWTGRDRQSTLEILKNNRAERKFERIISGTCVPNNKPELDGLRLLQEHFACDSRDLVMVGDHHHDIGPARQLGALSVHARWKPRALDLPGTLEADHSFDSVSNFRRWLDQQIS